MTQQNGKKNFLENLSSKFVIGIAVLSFSACSAAKSPAIDSRPEVIGLVEKEATVPEGVVRYCWEEPMVEKEVNGPGLDGDGKWYQPKYVAIREVRMGRWRPCRPVLSETQEGNRK